MHLGLPANATAAEVGKAMNAGCEYYDYDLCQKLRRRVTPLLQFIACDFAKVNSADVQAQAAGCSNGQPGGMDAATWAHS